MGMMLWQLVLLIVLSCLVVGCGPKARTSVAKIYRETALAKPGSYHLKFLLSGEGTLSEYFSRQQARVPELKDVNLPELEKLVRKAYPQLYPDLKTGSLLCNLEINFKHCRGIELLADLVMYADNTVVLYNFLYYHVNVRVERNQNNFYSAVKSQYERGEFTLPPRYPVEKLVDDIRNAMPILQEIATNYSRYIKDGNQEIEIDLTLEVNPERTSAAKNQQNISSAAEFSGQTAVSVLQGASFLANLTVSTLYSGGRTFWEVLQEERKFDLYRQNLGLKRVEFSYTGSFTRNLTKGWRNLMTPSSDILVREVVIRLREKEQKKVLTGNRTEAAPP
jgi:hypothetical protein